MIKVINLLSDTSSPELGVGFFVAKKLPFFSHDGLDQVSSTECSGQLLWKILSPPVAIQDDRAVNNALITTYKFARKEHI